MKKIYLLVCSIIVLQGCYATMALTGDREPNLSVIQKGQNKAIVESQPLKSFNTEVLKNGNIVSMYQYTMGNSPSAGRAKEKLLK